MSPNPNPQIQNPKSKGGFKNLKLGKNVYRQMKRRGPPPRPPEKQETRVPPKPRRGSG